MNKNKTIIFSLSIFFILLALVLVYFFQDKKEIVFKSIPAVQPEVETRGVATSSKPFTSYFELPSKLENISNTVGCFAEGAFCISLPFWMSYGWTSPRVEDNSITIFAPTTPPIERDFSDIVIITKESTELFNADWLFENERVNSYKDIVLTEVVMNDEEDIRTYHIQKSVGDIIFDTYYIDGNGKTAVIDFSASKSNYYYYGPKIKDFIDGIDLGKQPQG